jgi:hypothetical protein
VQPFNPTANEGDEKKKLKPAHLYGIAWMNSRLGEGGGIIGDQMGMGKVRLYLSLELIKTVQALTWIAMRKKKMGSKGPIALVITYVILT